MDQPLLLPSVTRSGRDEHKDTVKGTAQGLGPGRTLTQKHKIDLTLELRMHNRYMKQHETKPSKIHVIFFRAETGSR